MKRFELEDFFDTYEHVPELINLASSDALPWGMDRVADGVLTTAISNLTLKYPNVRKFLLPGLARLCKLPETAVLPTSGAAEAIALVIHELSRSSRDGLVAIPMPGYGAFAGLATLLGLRTETYEYHPDRNWAPDLDELIALSKRSAALLINNPHNPTGYLIPHDVLTTIAQEMEARGGTLIVDEVFRAEDEIESAAALGDHVITIGSLSKMYGLPGLRLGWVTAHPERISRLRTLQQYFTLTLNSFTVLLGAAVLDDLARFSRTELLAGNRKILLDWAETSKARLSISPPLGGTTVCLAIDSGVPAEELFKRFLNAKVLLAPGGRCFEYSRELNWFRLGYGTSPCALKDGLRHINEVIGR
jgi:aspartate/methionine/tyrosine aminotransferase